MRPAHRILDRRAALVLAAALLVSACGGKGIDTSPTSGLPGATSAADCSTASLDQAVLNTARQWYLFPETLPPSIDPASYTTVGAFVDALTAQARADGKDRFFSATTSIATETALLQGTTAGFGFTLLESASTGTVSIAQVFAGSAAADAGFVRGDALLEVGSTPTTLVPVAQLLASPGGLNDAIGPSSAGEARTLSWRSADGMVRTATLTKRSFDLDAVPTAGVRILTLPDGRRVGHLSLRSFVSDARSAGEAADLAALRNAFSQFAAKNVRDLIIDLRYNGGGLVSIAELLMNLIAGDRAGQVAFETRYNPLQAARLEVATLALQPQTVPTLRVAFIATDKTASASELVINAVAPYARTAMIGSRSFGKPVGQLAFDVAACDFRLRLVAFRSVNRDGDGDYYLGLPYAGFTRAGGVACRATDDLSRQPGDSAEAMTAEALAWLGSPSGSCSAGAIAAADETGTLAGTQTRTKTAAPFQAPSPLQDYLPGTY